MLEFIKMQRLSRDKRKRLCIDVHKQYKRLYPIFIKNIKPTDSKAITEDIIKFMSWLAMSLSDFELKRNLDICKVALDEQIESLNSKDMHERTFKFGDFFQRH